MTQNTLQRWPKLRIGGQCLIYPVNNSSQTYWAHFQSPKGRNSLEISKEQGTIDRNCYMGFKEGESICFLEAGAFCAIISCSNHCKQGLDHMIFTESDFLIKILGVITAVPSLFWGEKSPLGCLSHSAWPRYYIIVVVDIEYCRNKSIGVILWVSCLWCHSIRCNLQ